MVDWIMCTDVNLILFSMHRIFDIKEESREWRGTQRLYFEWIIQKVTN